ncbi:MAG: substrate-binding domain-containing protein [Mycobacterium sp.]
MGRHSAPGPDDDDDIDIDYTDDDEYDEYDDDRAAAADSDSVAGDPDDAADDGPRYDTATDLTPVSYSEEQTAVIPTQSPLRAENQGGHRNDGEWTGSHRTVVAGRRGVSLSVIAALVTVVVVVAAVILWRFFGDALSDRDNVAAGRCVEGDSAVAVLADPAIADSLGPFVEKFNESASPVADHCVAVSVRAADSDAVIDGFAGDWPADLGDKPALWIPGSSVSSARLQAAADPKTVSASTSLVTSPVLLAVRPELRPALDDQTWGTLPGLQSNPTALDGLDLPGWGSLRLALPTTGDSDASYLAAEAVAAASVRPGAPASDGTRAVSALRAGQPDLSDTSTDAAMKALLDGNPARAQVHAVVITEQQMFARSADLPDAKATVASWLPPGPVAVADFPAVLLGGDWLSTEQVSAASQFERFLREPEQSAALAAAGFRAADTTPPTSDVVSFAPLSSTLDIGDDEMRVTLANALTAPAAAPAVSLMLDSSLDALAPVVAAINERISALPPDAAVSLTTFDGGSSTSPIALGPLRDDVGGRPRSEAVTSALSGLTPGSAGAVSFTTLRNVWGEALSDFRPGQANSILVITAGPHTDQSLSASGLQDLVRSGADPARPVAVNVINFGDDPDRPTWESVAQISGGTYQNVPASSSPELGAALDAVLG